jgi:hypothetical protein
MCHTTSTILPPPSDFPVPMPDLTSTEPDSGEWRALVEVTKDTVRPGRHAGIDGDDLPTIESDALEDDVSVHSEGDPLEGVGRRLDGRVLDMPAEAQMRNHA